MFISHITLAKNILRTYWTENKKKLRIKKGIKKRIKRNWTTYKNTLYADTKNTYCLIPHSELDGMVWIVEASPKIPNVFYIGWLTVVCIIQSFASDMEWLPWFQAFGYRNDRFPFCPRPSLEHRLIHLLQFGLKSYPMFNSDRPNMSNLHKIRFKRLSTSMRRTSNEISTQKFGGLNVFYLFPGLPTICGDVHSHDTSTNAWPCHPRHYDVFSP